MRLLKVLGGDNLVEDYKRWRSLRCKSFLRMFLTLPEFRILCFYRMRMKNRFFRLLLLPLKLFNCHSLFIACTDIGTGFFIEHGFSTIIACRHIGRNCWINQQVTIGFSNKTDSPFIGDDVQIKAGAKIIGNVVIGDDVIVGANSVVVKDIPSHSIVVGVPAKIIKQRSKIDEDWKKI